jgi:tetratricopeptide (TPR) repeat protein
VDSAAFNAVTAGYQALSAGDLAAAERAFADAIQRDGKLAAGYLGMAEVAAQRAQGIRVDEWLKKALAADPNDAYAQRVWGHLLYQRGKFTDAAAAFNKAVNLSPDSLDARLNLGEAQLRGLKQPKAAEATYRSAITRWPDQASVHMALAAALVAQGRQNDAEAAFERASTLAPRDPEPLLAMARLQASRTEIDRALATLNRLLVVAPESAQAQIDRGDLLLLKNDVNAAMDAFRAAIKAAPGRTPGAHSRLGSLFEAQQNWPEAERAYRAAMKDEPSHVPAINNLAYMLAVRGERLDEARDLVKRGLELSPKQPALLDTQGWVHRARGEFSAAVASFDKAIALSPRNATYHYHLGLAQLDMKKPRDAQAAFRKALELDPKFRQADDAKKQLATLK